MGQAAAAKKRSDETCAKIVYNCTDADKLYALNAGSGYQR